MNIPIFHVDAFADSLFTGNPAAVCPLREWLPDHLLQAIAGENNLSETAFIVPAGDVYQIRWFSPTVEVDLCGHATLAAAFVLFRQLGESRPEISLQSRKGALRVRRSNDLITLDFPALPIRPCVHEPRLPAILGKSPLETVASDDLLALFPSERDVHELSPDFRAMGSLPFRGLIATAPADTPGVDFVSRFFAPACGIDEDPVTGSAHCELVPYWAERLKKSEFTARQISKRGGTLLCRLDGDRVLISGKGTLYLQGMIELPDQP